jgi:hypothetical protein
MMKAVSGAVAKDRRDVIKQAEEDYSLLLGSGDFGRIGSVAEDLRPLLESRDENALALWQRIARDFPRGNPIFATECEAVKDASEIAYRVQHPKPTFPGLPFARHSSIGKIRFSYRETREQEYLIVSNGASPPREFPGVGLCRKVVGSQESEDGLLHGLAYAQQGEDGRLIVGRRGVLIRIIDARGPSCLLELYRPGLQTQEMFMRWSHHTLLMFLGSEGLYAIDFDNVTSTITDADMPQPIIPDIITLFDVGFMGAHADELFTGENRWKICYDVLPFPERPYDDPRLGAYGKMLPKKPDERRALLLRNGFGNLWTELVLKAR